MVLGLAVMLVVQDVPLLTGAVVTGFEVGTPLSTESRRVAFIKVLADFSIIGIENFTIRTCTKSSVGSLYATVGTAVTITVIKRGKK